jgi:hypothetical protein
LEAVVKEEDEENQKNMTQRGLDEGLVAKKVENL